FPDPSPVAPHDARERSDRLVPVGREEPQARVVAAGLDLQARPLLERDHAVAPLLAERLDEDGVDPDEVAFGLDPVDLDPGWRLAGFQRRSVEIQLEVPERPHAL